MATRRAASLAAAGLAAALLVVGAGAAQSPSREDLDIAALKAIPETADSLWRLCRARVLRAQKRGTKAEKLADYDSAREDCGKSIALASANPEAHFWHGVSMGRWGETQGLLKAMFLVKPIRREMLETLRLDPNHGGAHHILGEMLWRIPRLAGGDKKKALAEFETAVRLSPNRTAAYRPLAEAYLHFERKADAVKILRALEAVKEPDDPAEYPENLADARELLTRLEGRR